MNYLDTLCATQDLGRIGGRAFSSIEMVSVPAGAATLHIPYRKHEESKNV